jgi:translocation and assembly module TamA
MTCLRGQLALTVLFGLFALMTSPVIAASVSYSVEITAPESVTGVLRDNLDIVSWAGREDVSEGQLRQLVKTAPDQVLSLLTTEGYFSSSVKVELDKGESGWLVRLLVEAGEPTRVISVDFRITGAIDADPDRDQRIREAREAFILNESMVFRQRDWDVSKQGVEHSLHRRRYAAARVTSSRAEIDPQTRQARLSVEIDSGPPFTFGAVEFINGLQRYPLSMVRNLSPIQPGDPYDEGLLLTYQKRLLRNGRFASAVVWAGSDPEQASATPVYVNVVESKARRVELSAGFSTNRGARGAIGYNDLDTFDRGLDFDTRLRIDQVSQTLFAGLALPRNRKGRVYGVDGRFEEQDIQGVKRTDWSVAGARTYVVETYKSQQILQLLAENRRLVDSSENNLIALYLAQNWAWNALDDILAPRKGFFADLEVGGSSREIVSDGTFGRVLANGYYFQPVSTFGTLQLRVEVGALSGDDSVNIPSEYLFRTGGDTSVRGYAYESLGVDVNSAVVGGRYLLVGSVEYIQWIKPKLGAAIFYDMGNAVQDISEYSAAAGYGVGVRWYSPIGPINFDVAYGEETDEFRVHFTAGYVFQ